MKLKIIGIIFIIISILLVIVAYLFFMKNSNYTYSGIYQNEQGTKIKIYEEDSKILLLINCESYNLEKKSNKISYQEEEYTIEFKNEKITIKGNDTDTFKISGIYNKNQNYDKNMYNEEVNNCEKWNGTYVGMSTTIELKRVSKDVISLSYFGNTPNGMEEIVSLDLKEENNILKTTVVENENNIEINVIKLDDGIRINVEHDSDNSGYDYLAGDFLLNK